MPRASSPLRATAGLYNPVEGARTQLIVKARKDSVEFPPFMANHLPMILVALDRLGAPVDRLESFFSTYRDIHGLVPIGMPESRRIDYHNWRGALGERSYEADFRAFFAEEVERLGSQRAQEHYLPDLAPGVAASALHALMRLAYANVSRDKQEVGIALAYWAATYLPLGDQCGGIPISEEPLDILLGLRSRLTRDPPKPDIDLLWHFMRATAALPEFAPVPGALIVTPKTLPRLRRAALILLASTMTFEALHAVTGCHWLRLLPPHCSAAPQIYAAFWSAIVSVYPKIGMPLPLDEVAIDAMRHMPLVPDWPEIAAAAIKSDDEHDISLTFSAREEWALTHDRLYQVVAAKRLGLV
jgi:hypothetical protein